MFTLQYHISFSFLTAVVATVFLLGSFFAVEPTVSRAAATAQSTFLITQQITDEISFLVAATNTTMVGSIQGISGGQATGTTFAVVRSNSAAGYTMDIAFTNNPAMRGSSTASTAIRNYATSSGMVEPSFAFVASSAAQFGYTVAASTTSDLDPSFLNNGTICNAGASYNANTCWARPSSTNFRIVNRGTSAPTGATTTLTFRVQVPTNPVPTVDQDFYIATATLTATNQ